MCEAVLRTVTEMDQQQLDFLQSQWRRRSPAPSAATERPYQLNTFDNVPPKELGNNPAFQEWAVAMDLGEPARQAIKGQNLNQYLSRLEEGRERTIRGVP